VGTGGNRISVIPTFPSNIKNDLFLKRSFSRLFHFTIIGSKDGAFGQELFW